MEGRSLSIRWFPSGLRILYEYLVTLVAVTYFAFFGLMLSLAGLLAWLLITDSSPHRLGRYGMHYAMKIFFAGLSLSGLVSLDLKELDRLRNERGIIIASNHPCLMDALFVSSRLPNLVCIMKASVLNNPILFGGAWLGGFIGSDSAKIFIRKSQKALREGDQLLLFPEGTRTLTSPINPLKDGIALIAKRSQAPIQTVFIDANSTFLGKNWPIWKKPPFPLRYRVTLGARFQVDYHQNHRVFTAELEEYFKEQLSRHPSP